VKYTNTNNNTKLLFKNYVKLTSQCLSHWTDDKEDLRLRSELKSVSCEDSCLVL